MGGMGARKRKIDFKMLSETCHRARKEGSGEGEDGGRGMMRRRERKLRASSRAEEAEIVLTAAPAALLAHALIRGANSEKECDPCCGLLGDLGEGIFVEKE